jgi:hypothetical protein
MTIFEYIALTNPNGAKNVINHFGEKANRNPRVLAKQVAMMVNKHGQEALFRIAQNHPDKELLKQYFEVQNPSKKDEEKCGCEKKENIWSSAEGQALKEKVQEISTKQDISNSQPKVDNNGKSEKTEMLIIGAIALVGLALVLKK